MLDYLSWSSQTKACLSALDGRNSALRRIFNCSHEVHSIILDFGTSCASSLACHHCFAIVVRKPTTVHTCSSPLMLGKWHKYCVTSWRKIRRADSLWLPSNYLGSIGFIFIAIITDVDLLAYEANLTIARPSNPILMAWAFSPMIRLIMWSCSSIASIHIALDWRSNNITFTWSNSS